MLNTDQFGNEEAKKNTVKSVLDFTIEVLKSRKKSVQKIEELQWSTKLSEIDENIPGVKKWTPETTQPNLLLSIEQQPFPEVPTPSEELKKWLIGDWRVVGWIPSHSDVIEEQSPSGDYESIAFESVPKLFDVYTSWLKNGKNGKINTIKLKKTESYFIK